MSSEEKLSKDILYMQNRELSWLEFNKRVLDQGADPDVPLLERLTFISIFWSNLQEFFMVRVGSLTDLELLKKTIIDGKTGWTPREQLEEVYKRCHELYPYYEACFKTLAQELGSVGVIRLRAKHLSVKQREYVDDYFKANIMPFLAPQIIDARHPFPHLENGSIYIVVRLDEESGVTKKRKDPQTAKKAKSENDFSGVTLGIIPLPKQCSRIIQLPGSGTQFTLLEYIIEEYVPYIFSMYKVKHTNIICVTRNADLDATEGNEEQGADYREHMRRILKKRSRLAPVRLESERKLSSTVRKELLSRLQLTDNQLFTTSVPLDLSYVSDLKKRIPEDVRKRLLFAPFSPQWPGMLNRSVPVLPQVLSKEILINYPYETMDAFVQLLKEAAFDPFVVSIKITLYRLANQSSLAEALITAAENGKEVTALFELRARFDESNNIEWSQRFEQAGCHVLYGFRDFKVHSKICHITRQTPQGLQHITQLGTGNYHEKTARLYTDFSFITTDPVIGNDAIKFFHNVALENISDEYEALWVAPLQIKQNILQKIDEQIAKKKAGEPSGIFFKTNSITDKSIIKKISEASKAGVPCTLLIRGISCIVPGVAGRTENVCVVSLVGRLLEHSRIFAFGSLDHDPEIYLSSADLMTRNMDKRVELAWPIRSQELKKMLIGYLATCMADTAKLRELLPNRTYTPIGFLAKADDDGAVHLFDSQAFLMNQARNFAMEDEEIIISSKPYDGAAIRAVAQEQTAILDDAERTLSIIDAPPTEFKALPEEKPSFWKRLFKKE